VIAPTIVARLLEHTRQSGSLAEQTSRDRELLGLMAEGHSNRGICQRLSLSPKPSKAHVHTIFFKPALGERP